MCIFLQKYTQPPPHLTPQMAVLCEVAKLGRPFIIPEGDNKHWWLLVVYPLHHTILILDSCRNRRAEERIQRCNWVVAVLEAGDSQVDVEEEQADSQLQDYLFSVEPEWRPEPLRLEEPGGAVPTDPSDFAQDASLDLGWRAVHQPCPQQLSDIECGMYVVDLMTRAVDAWGEQVCITTAPMPKGREKRLRHHMRTVLQAWDKPRAS
jgi:hypothetical protein